MSVDVFRTAAQASPVEHELSCANCGNTNIHLRETGPWCEDCAEFWAARSPEQRGDPGTSQGLHDYLTFGAAPAHEYVCSVLWRTGRTRRAQFVAYPTPMPWTREKGDR